MFDVGFFELLLIAVVGLVVIGPERLPGAIRAGALWWGRMKRSIRETRSELERQLGADEIRRELHNEEVMRSLEALRNTSKELEREVEQAAQDAAASPNPASTPANTIRAHKTDENKHD
jgi:sec-independent protein translocase protein TatB